MQVANRIGFFLTVSSRSASLERHSLIRYSMQEAKSLSVGDPAHRYLVMPRDAEL
jgi:hypothetical protein